MVGPSFFLLSRRKCSFVQFSSLCIQSICSLLSFRSMCVAFHTTPIHLASLSHVVMAKERKCVFLSLQYIHSMSFHVTMGHVERLINI